nr:GTP-binding protein [Halopseudomonas xiamenensis]
MPMLQQIPTHLLAGSLGAGKTSLLRQLLAQRPQQERWALLINEFGQIGIDAALLDTGSGTGVQLAEVAGGCLCCVNGLPFQVGLGRLLRAARPQRIFIEASGLGHPAALLQQLAAPPWQGVLALQPLVMVLDAAAMAAGAELPAAQQEALPQAGLLLMNKSAGLDSRQRQQLADKLPGIPLHWSEHGALPLAALPGHPVSTAGATLPPSAPSLSMPTLWRSQDHWLRQAGQQDDAYSLGWRMHPAQRFSRARLEHWLGRFAWQRAKGIVHTDAGWLSFNALPGAAMDWRPSPWRRDSRIELICTNRPDAAQLEHDLRAALQND